MANMITITEFTNSPAQVTFADFAGDFGPTAANDLRHASAVDTQAQLSLASVANNAARQSAKVDLGADRAQRYNVRAALEFAATPTAGNVVEIYWAPSQHSTAGTGNPGAVSGADAAYSGYSSNLDASVRQLIYIGAFIVTAQTTTTVQVAEVGEFSPPERYGSLVVYNKSAAAIHSDDVECHVVLDPIVSEVQ